MITRHVAKWTILSSVVMAIIAVWMIASVADAFADSEYYKTNTIYSEGIYIADGVYVEPCFEHFKDQNKNYKALRVTGDMPEGTKYTLFEHKGESYKQSGSDIPEISNIGVYRVDVKMPGNDPVTFQAEIVLEGIQPCQAIVGKSSADGKELNTGNPTYDGAKFVDEPGRETYNMMRGEQCSAVPSYSINDITQYRYNNPKEKHEDQSRFRRFVETKSHTAVLSFDWTPFGPLEKVYVCSYLYDNKFQFATHDEMKANREQYGE